MQSVNFSINTEVNSYSFINLNTMRNTLSPGAQAPFSGQYQLIGPRGAPRNKEITAIKGRILPPVPMPKMKYQFVDGTLNKSGGRRR